MKRGSAPGQVRLPAQVPQTDSKIARRTAGHLHPKSSAKAACVTAAATPRPGAPRLPTDGPDSVTKASKVAHNCSSSCVSDGGVTNGRARTARSRRAIHQRAPVKTKTKNCTSTTSIAKLYLSPIAHRTACSIFPEDTCRPTNSVIKRGAERARRTSGLSQRCRERPPSATTIRLTARSGTPG